MKDNGVIFIITDLLLEYISQVQAAGIGEDDAKLGEGPCGN